MSLQCWCTGSDWLALCNGTGVCKEYLRGTSITNAGVEHLSRLEKLKILTLDDSLVDDGMADSIRKMKQLTWLSVGN